MKKYNIKKLKLENFKLINYEKNIDFEDKKLIVLDGPNGYGKTTIFDAIEILIRGNRNIDDEYSTEYKDGDKPVFYANDTNKPVIIKGEFEDKEGNNIIIMRIIKNPHENGKLNSLKDRFETYELEQIEDSEGKKISQEYINSIFKLSPSEQIYNLMHYIQQEDTLFFLKNNENDRRKEINKLFNMDKQVKNKEKLVENRKKINNRKKSIEENIKKANQNLSKLVYKKLENVEYEKIITWKDIVWDRELLEIDEKNYQNIISEIDIVGDIVKNIQDIKNYKFNENIEYCLKKENEEILNGGIIALKHLDQYEILLKRFEDKKIITEFNKILESKNYDNIIKFIDNNIEFLLKVDVPIDINKMKQRIEGRINLKNDSNEIDSLILSINKVRNNLKNSFEKLIDKDKSQEDICPLCGYDYSKIEVNLLDEIDEKEKYFTNRLNETSKKVELIEKDILITYIEPLKLSLNEIINNIDISVDFITDLKKYNQIKERIIKLKDYLKTLNIDISKYWISNMKYDLYEVAKIRELLKNDISSKRIEIINTDFIYNKQKEITTVISSIFDNKIKNVEFLNIDSIEKKKMYIQNLYFEISNQERIKLLKQIDLYEKQAKILNAYIIDCDKIIKTYTEKIRDYSDDMIKKLQIPLYIYSGKIIQQYQGGLGIFIRTEETPQQIRLKFVNRNDNKHDVIKMFSSGQLSGLVISLILSINRIFCKNDLNTILIDDPLQNMDDINMASFVELLRNEFADKQIILSTHDERISRFIRYKYHKFGIESMRYNVKEKLN
ncbi:AAA family ATPase [Romboutsia ilealis]|uniref:AAA family ATPase n=1 Tax=Romboutsia ilealis TaxID=1115758 RepID=UPI0023F18011|nr:AAA family ATPase [Romboutsia ilealis]